MNARQALPEVRHADDERQPFSRQWRVWTATVARRDLATLLAYVETGSHKNAAVRMGISESACRKRVARVMGTVDARNAAQAVWRLRQELSELEASQRIA